MNDNVITELVILSIKRFYNLELIYILYDKFMLFNFYDLSANS